MGVKWTPDLAVGVDAIDQQHQELYNKVNALLDAMQQGKGKEEIAKVVRFLQDYVVSHFGMEERLMAQGRYPGMETHKALHAAFVQEFLEIKAKLEKDGASSAMLIALQRRLGEWLRDHIGKVDKALGAFLSSR